MHGKGLLDKGWPGQDYNCSMSPRGDQDKLPAGRPQSLGRGEDTETQGQVPQQSAGQHEEEGHLGWRRGAAANTLFSL